MAEARRRARRAVRRRARARGRAPRRRSSCRRWSGRSAGARRRSRRAPRRASAPARVNAPPPAAPAAPRRIARRGPSGRSLLVSASLLLASPSAAYGVRATTSLFAVVEIEVVGASPAVGRRSGGARAARGREPRRPRRRRRRPPRAGLPDVVGVTHDRAFPHTLASSSGRSARRRPPRGARGVARLRARPRRPPARATGARRRCRGSGSPRDARPSAGDTLADARRGARRGCSRSPHDGAAPRPRVRDRARTS